MNLLDLMAVLPLTSARSSLVLSLSIFSFQSFDRSFSMQEDSVEWREKKGKGRHLCITLLISQQGLFCGGRGLCSKNDSMIVKI